MASLVLSVDLLGELAARWQQRAIPAEDHLAPGLSDAALDSFESDLGFALPAEVRTWFGWHNGMSPTDPLPGVVSPDLCGLGLGRVVQETFEYRAIMADVASNEPEGLYPFEIWPRTRLQLYFSGGPVMVECSGEAPDGRSPVFWWNSHDAIREEQVTDPVAGSLGELVTWWIEAWDDGSYGWDANTNQQTYDWERVPQERSALV